MRGYTDSGLFNEQHLISAASNGCRRKCTILSTRLKIESPWSLWDDNYCAPHIVALRAASLVANLKQHCYETSIREPFPAITLMALVATTQCERSIINVLSSVS